MYKHARTKVQAWINIHICTSMHKTLMNRVTQQIRAHYHASSNTHATNILTDKLALTCMLQYTCTIIDAHKQTLNITHDKTHAQILKHQTIMQQHALNRMHSMACTQHHAFNIIDVTTWTQHSPHNRQHNTNIHTYTHTYANTHANMHRNTTTHTPKHMH